MSTSPPTQPCPHRPPARSRRRTLVPRRPRHDQGRVRDHRRQARGDRVRLAEGSGSPLHVHRNEDEWFYVIEGELTIWVGGEVVVAPAGSFVWGPRDVPHTFLVTARGPLPDGHRPRAVRGLHPLGVGAGSGADPAALVGAAPDPGGADGHRRRVRDRDPRPSRYPRLSSDRASVERLDRPIEALCARGYASRR